MQLYADSFKYQDLLCSHEQCQKKLFVAPYTLPQLVEEKFTKRRLSTCPPLARFDFERAIYTNGFNTRAGFLEHRDVLGPCRSVIAALVRVSTA